jgi:Tol biopolymer transport system component
MLVFVSIEGDSRRLATMSMASRDVTVVSESLAVTEPELSADLSLIVFQLDARGAPNDPSDADTEIAVMPRAGGEVRFVTVNAARDRNPRFAPDRARVFFETQHRDPQTGDPRMKVRWADIP